MLCLDACLNQFLLDILKVSDIPGDTDQKRFAPFHRDKRFQCLHNTGLAGGRHVGLLHIDPFMRPNQFQIIPAEPFGICTLRKDLKVCSADCPGGRNLGMFGKCLVPIQISEIVLGIFHIQIDRDIIQNTVQQEIQFTKFIPLLYYIGNVLRKKLDKLRIILLCKVGRDLVYSVFLLTFAHIRCTV